jgi:hypothetical protein
MQSNRLLAMQIEAIHRTKCSELEAGTVEIDTRFPSHRPSQCRGYSSYDGTDQARVPPNWLKGPTARTTPGQVDDAEPAQNGEVRGPGSKGPGWRSSMVAAGSLHASESDLPAVARCALHGATTKAGGVAAQEFGATAGAKHASTSSALRHCAPEAATTAAHGEAPVCNTGQGASMRDRVLPNGKSNIAHCEDHPQADEGAVALSLPQAAPSLSLAASSAFFSTSDTSPDISVEPSAPNVAQVQSVTLAATNGYSPAVAAAQPPLQSTFRDDSTPLIPGSHAISGDLSDEADAESDSVPRPESMRASNGAAQLEEALRHGLDWLTTASAVGAEQQRLEEGAQLLSEFCTPQQVGFKSDALRAVNIGAPPQVAHRGFHRAVSMRVN